MDVKTFYKISYGLYIVCSKIDTRYNGQIVNTVFQVTSEPPTIAVSINNKNLTYEYINNSKVFTVSILSKNTDMKLIGNFGFKSGREINKFNNVNYKIGVTGVPIIIDDVIGYIEAELINSLNLGSHTVFIGKVISAEILKEDEPMTYAYYHNIKKGISTENAPTYIKKEDKETITKSERYVCSVCGYIYDPELGDPDSGIKPGTPFELLPETWVCPVCGVGKDKFVKET